MMLTVKENLITLLETLCPDNVYLQGTLNPDEAYPDTFITFFITTSDYNAFYDNEANEIDWSISVMVYSNNPETVSTLSMQVITLLKSNGFIPESAGNDLSSGVDTHTGWALDFIYKQTNLNDLNE